MVNFKISAPGRIVLSGEHSAMYRKHFIATSLNLRTHLEFWELSDKTQIEIDFPQVNLQFDIPLERVRSFLSENDVDITSDIISVHKYVNSLITLNCIWWTLKQRFSLKIFFLLLYTIACAKHLDITPFRVRVSTEIPLGAGLGSSTSFAVCLAACFLHWKRLKSGDHSIEFNNNEFLKNVRSYARFCEKFMQDYECASVNTNVCTYGMIIKSQRTNHINIDMVGQSIKEMKILLIDSKNRQKKSYQAKQMAKLKFDSRNSSEFDTILNKLDNAAITMYNRLTLIDRNIENTNLRAIQWLYNLLQSSIELNQQFLKEYNLSNQTFDNICTTAHNNGYKGKLTGFGARYVYIVLPPGITEEEITNIKNHLEEGNNFTVTPTSINCEGLRIDN